MTLHRDLGMSHTSAWQIAHHIRETRRDQQPAGFTGLVEANESYLRGLAVKKPVCRCEHARRGTTGKMAVAGVKNRVTDKVGVAVVQDTARQSITGSANVSAAKFTRTGWRASGAS